MVSIWPFFPFCYVILIIKYIKFYLLIPAIQIHLKPLFILLSITCPFSIIIFSITTGFLPPSPLAEDTVGTARCSVPLVNGWTLTRADLNPSSLMPLLLLLFYPYLFIFRIFEKKMGTKKWKSRINKKNNNLLSLITKWKGNLMIYKNKFIISPTIGIFLLISLNYAIIGITVKYHQQYLEYQKNYKEVLLLLIHF